jgi:hypothetical protein
VVVRLPDDRLEPLDGWIDQRIREHGEVLSRAAVMRLALDQFLRKTKP